MKEEETTVSRRASLSIYIKELFEQSKKRSIRDSILAFAIIGFIAKE
jgi:hypothetical protein